MHEIQSHINEGSLSFQCLSWYVAFVFIAIYHSFVQSSQNRFFKNPWYCFHLRIPYPFSSIAPKESTHVYAAKCHLYSHLTWKFADCTCDVDVILTDLFFNLLAYDFTTEGNHSMHAHFFMTFTFIYKSKVMV